MSINIIPQPQKINLKGSVPAFVLTDSVNIIALEGTENAERELHSFLLSAFEITPTGGGKETVILKISNECLPNEGYKITAEQDRITVLGVDGAGVFYGVQSLKQLLLSCKGEVPEAEIEDFPAYPYRGFMLDCSRYFYKKEDVLTFLDIMASHKLNYFHWHLSDDQGFRIELYNKPLLAHIGGHRAFTNFGKTPHGGFYTKADIEEIIAYAHERYIKVIPELDQPGHTVSLIAAYPFLSCFDREIPVATHTGVKHDVLCVGKESTFEFMKEVLDEICEMFPDKIIHIGGDEVPTTRWQICPHCQKRMKEEGLTDVRKLHTYYLNRVGEYLRSKGFKVIMWNDEDANSGTDTELAWQFWDKKLTKEMLSAQLERGRDVINSSSKAFYLDLPYGYINLQQAYCCDIAEGITQQEQLKHLKGGEACLWTEYVPNMKKAGYCTFPRLGANAEILWTKKENQSFEAFLDKLPTYYHLLKIMGQRPAAPKQSMPGFLRKYGYIAFFERRQLHWEGLHNIIENKKVEKMAKSNS